jgi:lipopolysaccharide/colanic/teichoic acid biosynthesis glycosyltransferase
MFAQLQEEGRVSPGSRLQPMPTRESEAAGKPNTAELDFSVADRWIYRFGKRTFDVATALIGLTLLLPLIPVIVALIKLDSSGSVLFSQKRVGRDGRLFTCYKFRSMVDNAESMKAQLAEFNEASGAAFKIRQDPRITEIGAFLRKSSLDEMPQMWNVLKGDMSIVGPRPQIPAEVALYAAWHRRRLEVRPGITCLWQIAGRSHVGFDEWMRLDVEYVRRRSMKLDLWILLRTLPAVMARKGAY